MLGRFAAVAVCVALAGCAGLEPAGRNAQRAPQATRVGRAEPAPVVTPAPTSAPVLTAPAPAVSTPAPVVTATPAPRSAPVVAATPAPTPPPPVVAAAPAPRVVATPPPAEPAPIVTASRNDDDIVVPGQRERQVEPPNGDPRSNAERMEDIRAWDQCVSRVQAVFERDPMRPQMDSPEEYCGRSLGMADRTAIPLSRLERRR